MSGLYVISGPSAVGKGTLVHILQQRYQDIWVSISATTRAPRKTETDGVDYFFVSDQEFNELIETGRMLEWAEIHGKTRYGTPKEPVVAALKSGKTVLLEIDVQGAYQVRQSYPEAHLVFIAPPSRETLLQRIKGRGTETDEQITRRLTTADWEMTQEENFDYVVINDVLEETVDHLVELFGLQVSN